jgi:hypothetical protein
MAGGAASSDPVFKAYLIDGRTVSGHIASLGPGAIRLAASDGKSIDLTAAKLLKLIRESPSPGSLPAIDCGHVIFPDGDRLLRTMIGTSTETTLDVKSDALGKLAIPLEAILGLHFVSDLESPLFDSFWERIRTEPRSSELVWLSNGDRLAGEFLGLESAKVKIQVAGKPVLVDRPSVVAIGFDSKLVNYPRPASGFLDVTLRDGSRLGVTEPRLDDGTVMATTRFGGAIRFSINDLVRVYVRSASVDYLSERKVSGDKYLSYVGPTRAYRVDRTVDGHLFRLAGQTFDRGIGTESTTFLAFKIEPNDARFQATVGVDERAGPLGSVVFRVLVDGTERLKTPSMTVHDTPRNLDVDLRGGKFLILATEFGDRGNVRDLADWVEARIIREE